MKEQVQQQSETSGHGPSLEDSASWKLQLKQDLRSMSYSEQVGRVQLKGGGTGRSEDVARAGFTEGSAALPHKAAMESHFGTDLSGVSAHVAPRACGTLGAEAYAFGTSVAFKDAAPSKETVAHEITHTLGGGEAQADAAEKSVGAGISQPPVQYKMKGSGPVQRKATPEEEGKLRQGVADGMDKANYSGGMRYFKPGKDPEKWNGGRAPEKFWDKTGWYTFELKPGQSATEAIDAMFAGPTILECLSVTKAILIRSIRMTLGQARFDKAFGEKGKNNQSLTVTATGNSQLDQYLVSEMIKPADLKTGDWGYFHNHPKYLVKHPAGFWQGENAVYMGSGKWAGFGASNKSSRQMIAALKDAYNKGRTTHDDAQMKKIDKTIEDNMGAQGYSDGTTRKVKKVWETYYGDYPATVADADIPGIDGANAVKKEVAKQLDKLKAKEGETLALVDEWSAKNGQNAALVKAQVQAQLQAERNRLKQVEANAASQAGKMNVTRLDADKVMELGK